MHEVVAAATSLAGAGDVTLPAPSTASARTGFGVVSAYRPTEFDSGIAARIGRLAGARTVS